MNVMGMEDKINAPVNSMLRGETGKAELSR